MLRLQGIKSSSARGVVRGFKTQSRLLQEAKPSTPKPKKKTKKFRNFLVTSFGLGAGLYAGGVYYSLKDDHFMDFFTEYVPFSERVINYMEERQFRRQMQNHESGNPEAPQHVTPADLDRLVKITKAGAEPHEREKEDPQDRKKKEAEANNKKESKQQEQPSSPPITKKSSQTEDHLPLVHIPKESDSVVSEAVDKLNQFIQAVNKSAHTEEAVSSISQTLTKLSQSMDKLKREQKEELEKKVQEQSEKLKKEYQDREERTNQQIESLQREFSQIFQSEQQRIIDLYNQRLLTEIEATKKAVISHANNRLVAATAERERQFAQQVAKKVEEERDGRLAKIKELTQSVKELQELSLMTDEILKNSQNTAEFHAGVSGLHNALGREEPVSLRPFIRKILNASGDDPLVKAAVEAIPGNVYDEGVLSPAQLAARFKMLEPEMRKVSLLPPEAGIAGHFGSWLFSTLLWKKQGNPVGDDIESVIARTQNALTEGRVLDAVSEVNSLDGWPKKLAKDWLGEGRKRCEVEFLVKTLGEEGKLRK